MGKRRAYVRLPDRILREPWDDSTLADIVRLQAFLNTRWARDGLPASEAGKAFLGPQEMMLITRTTNVSRARKRLLALPARAVNVTLAVAEAYAGRTPGVRLPSHDRLAGVTIDWPKFAIEQGYYDREEPKLGREKAPPHPLPQPQTLSAKEREERPSPAAPPSAPPAAPPAPSAGSLARVSSKGNRKKPETPVPDRLTSPDRQRVMAWAASQSPPISDHALGYAWKAYTAKARARQYRYADHAQAFMNALGASGEAWALKGYEPPSKPGGGRYRSAEDVLADARAKAAADDARSRESEPEDPVAVAALIDRSLRPPLALVRPAPAAAEAETA